MSEQHPLTDELIDKITYVDTDLTHEQFVNRNDDMRTAWDLAIEHVYETWNRIGEEVDNDPTLIPDRALSVALCWRFSRELEAMRPQEESS